MKKTIITIIVLVAIGAGAYLLLGANKDGNSPISRLGSAESPESQSSEDANNKDADEIRQRETQGALAVENQKAGTSMKVKQAEFPAPGFVVIYRDAGNRPGGIIAQSKLLEKGTHKDIEIKTEVYPIEKGKQYYMMINLDDGDKIFDAGKDLPTLNKSGGSYMVTFKAL